MRNADGALVDATFGVVAAALLPLLLLLLATVLDALHALPQRRLVLPPPLSGGRRRSLAWRRCGCSFIAIDAATALMRARRDAQIAQRDALSFTFTNVHTLHGHPILFLDDVDRPLHPSSCTCVLTGRTDDSLAISGRSSWSPVFRGRGFLCGCWVLC